MSQTVTIPLKEYQQLVSQSLELIETQRRMDALQRVAMATVDSLRLAYEGKPLSESEHFTRITSTEVRTYLEQSHAAMCGICALAQEALDARAADRADPSPG